MYPLRQPFQILGPQCTISAAQLQNIHSLMDLALPENPWKPALLIYGIQAVQIDPGRNIGSILLLVFQALFHNCQMDQIQHTAPVYGVFLGNRPSGVL